MDISLAESSLKTLSIPDKNNNRKRQLYDKNRNLRTYQRWMALFWFLQASSSSSSWFSFHPLSSLASDEHRPCSLCPNTPSVVFTFTCKGKFQEEVYILWSATRFRTKNSGEVNYMMDGTHRTTFDPLVRCNFLWHIFALIEVVFSLKLMVWLLHVVENNTHFVMPLN